MVYGVKRTCYQSSAIHSQIQIKYTSNVMQNAESVNTPQEHDSLFDSSLQNCSFLRISYQIIHLITQRVGVSHRGREQQQPEPDDVNGGGRGRHGDDDRHDRIDGDAIVLVNVAGHGGIVDHAAAARVLLRQRRLRQRQLLQ